MIRWIVFCPVINKIGWLAIKSHLPACLSIKQWSNRWIVTFFSELEWSQSRNQLRQLWGCRKVCLLLPLKYFWPLRMADVFSCLPRISSSWRVWWSKVGPTMDSVRLPSWVRVAGLWFDSGEVGSLALPSMSSGRLLTREMSPVGTSDSLCESVPCESTEWLLMLWRHRFELQEQKSDGCAICGFVVVISLFWVLCCCVALPHCVLWNEVGRLVIAVVIGTLQWLFFFFK